MTDIIKDVLKEEELVGILPVQSKRLQIPAANISYAPSFGNYGAMLACCFPLIVVFGSTLAFILIDMGASLKAVLCMFLLLTLLLLSLADALYVHKIKKYPNVYLALTTTNLHYFIFKNNQLLKSNPLDVNVSKLESNFFGELNNKRNVIKERFEIKKDGKTLMSGKLKIKNNRWLTEQIRLEDLLPMKRLQQIYVSTE